MKLNFDIIITILSHIQSSSDLSACSRTCRTLHAAGVRELIKTGVVLNHEDDFASFLLFITARDNAGPPRASHVKRLTINVSDSYLEQGAYTECMAQILDCCTALEILKIDDGSLLDVDIRIGLSLNRIMHLQELDLELVGGVVNLLPLLANMRSQCSKISLDYSFQDNKLENAFNGDLLTTLIASISSLQTLCITNPTFKTSSLVFPRLTTLTICVWVVRMEHCNGIANRMMRLCQLRVPLAFL